MKITDWFGAYDNGWKGLITDASMAHPAKFSRGLIFRIVEYLLKSEMVKPGDTVIDPFGGVGLGALPCLLNGLNWKGCELESRFVELGRKNIDLWNTKFASMPKWTGKAVLLQGDSRKLAEVIGAAGGLVSSPPYASSETNAGNVGNAIKRETWGNGTTLAAHKSGYGSTPGQLGAMPEGRPLVVSSPPFAGNSGGRGKASRNGIDPALFDRHQGAMVGGIGSEGNLAGLKPGDVALVSSPPFESSLNNGLSQADREKYEPLARNGRGVGTDYGTTEGQLGQAESETFWSAAAVIISQCHQLLPPRRSRRLCRQVICS